MAARTVDCYFKNLANQTLTPASEHLDRGVYTDPWYPPQTKSVLCLRKQIFNSPLF
jgi:hypothetical protein